MNTEKSEEAYVCKTCGKTGEKEHLCNPAPEETGCNFCGCAGAETRHMCKDMLQQAQYFCTDCGRVATDEQCICNPEKIT